MKFNRLYLLFLLVGSFSITGLQAQRVLFIGLDGVRSDALIAANTPNLDGLMNTGLYTYTSWHLGITSSGPSWSDMLCGVWESKHGVTSNNYTGSKYNDYPYFVTRAKEKRTGLKAVQITSWGPMSYNVYNDGWDNKIIVPTDNACVLTAKTQLLDPDLDVLFVHLDDCDAAGHANGFHPTITSYIKAIETVDAQVGDIVNQLQLRPNYASEDWLILLTTDHGGIGLTHGGATVDEKEIWWIANGGGVANMQITINLNDPNAWENAPQLVDIGVTALDHLLPGVDPEMEAAWDLDGKSWLNFPVFIEDARQGENGFEIYPNPNHGIFQAVLTALGTKVTYQLTDLSGTVLASAEVKTLAGNQVELPFQLEGYAEGIYFLNIENGDERSVRKVLIK